jgi:prepilin-type N-terminal cleavage/methylation domain-containing protein
MAKIHCVMGKTAVNESAEGGFTLVEMLIAMVLLVVIMGSLAGAAIVGLGLTSPTSQKLSESNDARLAAAWFGIDVRNGEQFAVTPSTTGLCAASSSMSSPTDLIDVWPSSSGGSDVSWYYGAIKSNWWLERVTCSSGGANLAYTPVARMLSKTVAPVIVCGASASTCPTGDFYATSVSMTVTELDGYSYKLSAVSRAGLQASEWSTPPSLSEAALFLGTSGVSLTGSATLNVVGNMVVDTPSTGTAISVSNGASINEQTTGDTVSTISGSTCSGCSTGITPSAAQSGIGTLASATADPYNSTNFVLPAPSSPSCATGASPTCYYTYASTMTYTSCGTAATGSSEPLSPGVYENQVNVTSGGATVTLCAGTYIFENGIQIGNGGGLTSNQLSVFFYIGCPATLPTGQSSCTDTSAAFTVGTSGGGSSVNLTAPTSGQYNGIVLFQARDDPSTIILGNGTSTASLNGIIYAPDAEVEVSGGSSNMFEGVIASSFNGSNGAPFTLG